MHIDSIQNGIVLDHIKAGKGMLIYNTLELDKLDCTVAILKKVPSKRMGKKDIIKIGAHLNFDYDSLAYISPNITVNIIKDGELVEKKHIKLPKTLVDILKCKNPRCICSTEQDIQHIFWLSDPEDGTYRCRYCDTKYS